MALTCSYRRDTCRLCEGKNLEMVLSLEPTPIADAYVSEDRLNEDQPLFPLDLYLCRACGHVQLLDVVDPDLLFANYTYASSVSLGLMEHFRNYSQSLLQRLHPPAGAFIVDIGSNDGSFLKFFKQAGMNVLGIDPAAEVVRRATASGIDTRVDYFTAKLANRILQERGPAFIITANNVFAHADHLGDICQGVHDLLSPGGVFVCEVAYLPDLLHNMLFDTIYHEHLCYHSVKPLQSFFRQYDMELIDVERVNSKGGSIRCMAQRRGGLFPVSPSVKDMIAHEIEQGIFYPEVFRVFGLKLQQMKKDLLRLVRGLREQGNVIAGYGASATVTTLLYHFRLEGIMACLFDDNLVKQGRYSPGCHIPIYASQEIYSRRPDYIVILAWQYAEPIMKKHSAYVEQGGRFILPMPAVTTIG